MGGPGQVTTEGAEADAPAEAPERTAGRSWGPLLRALVLAAPVLVLVERAWHRRWVFDDGFINFRVVDMVLAGHGPVFNPGERVEVTTSTLWLWTLVVSDVLLPLRLEWIAVVVGIAFSAAGLALAIAASVRLHRLVGAGEGRWAFPAGALVLAAVPPIWDYSTSGLEGGLTFFWIGGVEWILVRWAERARDDSPATAVAATAAASGNGNGSSGSAAGDDDGADDAEARDAAAAGAARRTTVGALRPLAALAIGLGPLIRPDLALVTLACLAAVVAVQWRTDTWGARFRLAGAAFAIPVAWQIFRMGYYGTLVPNTALAKAADRPRWEAGWAYVKDLFGVYVLLVPLALLAAAVAWPLVRRAWAHGWRTRVAVGLLPLAGLVDATYVVRAGGDYLHGRLLLPALWCLIVPFAATTLPSPADVRRTVPGALRVAALGAVAVWAAVCIQSLRLTLNARMEGGSNIVDARQLAAGHPVTREDWGWGDVDYWIQDPGEPVYAPFTPVDGAVPPDDLRTPVVLAYGVGLTGYSLGEDYTIIDLLGLADPLVSRLRLDRPGVMGHEKPLPTPWMAAMVSTEPVDPDDFPGVDIVPPLYVPADEDFQDDVEDARRALQCEPIQDMYAAVREPLTPGRFLSNLVHSPELTRLRVPPIPGEAVDDLCGD